jgi:hypothetical protein
MLLKLLMIPCAAALVAAGAESTQTVNINVTELANGIVNQSKQARQAVAAGDRTTALSDIDSAISMADTITSTAAPSVVPLYREVETTTLYAPVKPKHDHFKKETSVREVTGEESSASLDVPAARGNLQAARSALLNDDFTAAGASLDAIQASVVAVNGTHDVPLLMARQNLELARERVLEGKYKDAKMPLMSAAEAIQQYREESHGPQAKQGKYLAHSIQEYAEHIKHHHDDALTRIQDWSAEVNNWYSAQTS